MAEGRKTGKLCTDVHTTVFIHVFLLPGTVKVKEGLAQMLKGGIIMDVVNVEQARIAEEAGACAVMALERVPADIRKEGGVARMADPQVLSLSLCLYLSISSHKPQHTQCYHRK